MGAPSGVMVRTTAPINLVRGRPWSVACVWQTPAGIGINIVGFTITAELVFFGATLAVTVTVTDGARGGFELSLDDPETAGLPEDGTVTLAIELIDVSGNTSDFAVPMNVQTPITT